MKLTLAQRFETLKILPVQGTFVTLKIVADLRNSLAPSEEEFKYYGIVQKENSVVWDGVKGKEEVDIEIGEKATDIIVEALKKLDKEGALVNSQVPLYEKFVIG